MFISGSVHLLDGDRGLDPMPAGPIGDLVLKRSGSLVALGRGVDDRSTLDDHRGSERLRIAIVFDQEKTIYRAVTLVYANTDVLMLDETKNEISTTRDITDLVPVYSFNENHIWYHWKKDARPPAQFLQTDMQKQYPVFP